MGFPNIRITEAGRLLMAEVFGGASLQFTHFALGSGVCGSQEDWDGLTAPINHVMDISISDYKKDGEIVTLHGEFSNNEVQSEFMWRELAIYATLSDVEGYGSVMCFYGNADNRAEFVPESGSTSQVTYRWDTTLKVNSEANVSAIVQSVTFATTEQLNRHIENKQNPHNVSKAQVGLGDVPNVSTNNQTPTYDTPDSLTKLSSGERLATAFGKIAKAIEMVIDHFKDYKNPHKVDHVATGAAKKMHQSIYTEYGMATMKYFGHVKLSDAVDSTDSAGDGIAASPKAVKMAYDQAVQGTSVSGSYRGEGKCGSNRPNSITIEGHDIPKSVMIYEKKANTQFVNYGTIIISPTLEIVGFTCVNGVQRMLQVRDYGNVQGDNMGNTSFVSTTLEWYYEGNENNPEAQLDAAGSTYVWVAIY